MCEAKNYIQKNKLPERFKTLTSQKEMYEEVCSIRDSVSQGVSDVFLQLPDEDGNIGLIKVERIVFDVLGLDPGDILRKSVATGNPGLLDK